LRRRRAKCNDDRGPDQRPLAVQPPAAALNQWITRPDGKQPYYISAADGSVLSFAGLLDRWRDPANGEFVTAGLVRDGLRRSMSGGQPHAALPRLLNERKPKHLFFDFRTRHQVDAAIHHHLVNGVRVLLFQGAEIVPQHPVKLNGRNV